jgi:hypothetical protein
MTRRGSAVRLITVSERSIERGPCPSCGLGRVEITVERRKRAGLAVVRAVLAVAGCRNKTCRWYDAAKPS